MLETITIIAAIIGTATILLMTAVQNSMAIGSTSVAIKAAPAIVAAATMP